MKRYRVTVEITTEHTIEIDAEDEQDAETRIENMDDCEIVNQAVHSEGVGVEFRNTEEVFREDSP